MPVHILKRSDDVIVIREKREPPYRIRKRRIPKPSVHIRRPPSKKNRPKSKPKPKYGPPNINYKPLASYTSEYVDNYNTPNFLKGHQSIGASGPSVVYPSQTFGEPPVIPVATISESKYPLIPPKTRYGTPSITSSISTSYSAGSSQDGNPFSNNNPYKFKHSSKTPSVSRPALTYGTPIESGFSPNSGPTGFSSLDSSDFDFDMYKSTGFELESTKYHQEPKRPPQNDYAINNFPLDNGYVPDLYKTSVSSYDAPAYKKENFENYPPGTQFSSNPPPLPNHYDQHEFKTPTRTSNGLQTGSNSFYDPQDYTTYLNDVSESKKIPVKTKQKSKYPKVNFEDLEQQLKSITLPPSFSDSEDDLRYAFTQRTPTTTTTTTTKRPKYRRRKKPQYASNNQHTLDTDDLKDAFSDNTDFHEVSLTPDELLEFEPQRKVVNNARPTAITNPNQFSRYKNSYKNVEPTASESEEVTEPPRSKIHSTLTRSRIRNGNRNKPTSYPLKSPNQKDEKIEMSIEKSKSHAFYGGAVPENEFLNSFGLARRSDDSVNEFSVGTGISFGGANQGDTITGVWNSDYDPLPKNHKYS